MQNIRKLSIRTQLLMIDCIIPLVVILIIVISYTKASEIIQEKNNQYSIQIISQVNTTINSKLDAVNQLIQNIEYNTYVQEFLSTSDFQKRMKLKPIVDNYVSQIMSLNNSIIDIAFFCTDGYIFTENGKLTNVLDYQKILPKNTPTIYYSRSLTISGGTLQCIFAGARIYSKINFIAGENELGYMLVALNSKTLFGFVIDNENQSDQTKLYVLDRDNKVIISNDANTQSGSSYSSIFSDIGRDKKTIEYISKINKEAYIIQKEEIPAISGFIVFAVPYSLLTSGLNQMLTLQIAIATIALILLTLTFIYVLNNILKPLKKLIQYIQTIKQPNQNEVINIVSLHGYAEIEMLADNFNHLIAETHTLTDNLVKANTRLLRTELIKKQAELSYLKSQINPHFLYNTLESIKGIAAECEDKRVVNITKALGEIFKYSIKGDDFVTVAQELSIAKSYLYIQQVRFSHRFKTVYNIDKSTMNKRMPKMILQPIIENAVFHGIEPKTGKGILNIKCYVDGGNLIFFINDNGIGMNNDTLIDVQSKLMNLDDNTNQSRDIGLHSVAARIKLLYGDAGEIGISSSINQGTEVCLRIPLEGEYHL